MASYSAATIDSIDMPFLTLVCKCHLATQIRRALRSRPIFIPLKRAWGNLCACNSLQDNTNFGKVSRRVEFWNRIDVTKVSEKIRDHFLRAHCDDARTPVNRLVVHCLSREGLTSHLTQLFSREYAFSIVDTV